MSGSRTANINLAPYLTRSDGISWIDRTDPLYEIEWHEAILTKWVDISTIEHTISISSTGTAVPSIKKEWSPIDVSPSKLFTVNSIRVVAALYQFGQLSTLQLATLLDRTPRQIWLAASSLFSYGVLERAWPEWRSDEYDDRPYGGVGSIWRIDTKSHRVGMWLDELSDLEFSLLAGSGDPTSSAAGGMSSSALRHNLSTAEICIRALELQPGILGAWGEPNTLAESFLPSVTGIREGMRQNIADAALVYQSGQIILLESSGTANLESSAQRLIQKIATWSAIAAKSSLDIKIVAIDIGKSGRRNKFGWCIEQGVEASHKFLPKSSDRREAAARVFSVNAYDWFPILHGVSEGFLNMEGWNVGSKTYEQIVDQTAPLNPDSDVVVNTLAALHTPTWVLEDPS